MPQPYYITQITVAMFSNAYQYGPILEVWDARIDPNKHSLYHQLAKTNSTHPRAFDKLTKNYLHSLQGLNTRITLPAEDSKSLALHQRYLILQLHVPLGSNWWMELGFTDLSGTRRRVNLTTVAGKQEGKYFSYRYPLEVTRETWLFLAIDLYSFMEAFKGQTFRALDHIAVGSTCRLRRIFTMKQFVQYQIPKSFWLPHQLPQSLELVTFQDINRQHTVATKVETLSEKKEMSAPKESSIKKNENSSLVPLANRRQGRPSRSPEDIIDQAKKRLQSLQKEEELLIQKSQRVGDSPLQLKKGEKLSRSEVSPKIHKEKQVKRKLPPLERPFQEDEALNLKGEESSSQNEAKESRFLQSKDGVFPSTVVYRGEIKGEGPRELELIFDEMVGCYYHPETNSYFQLKP